MCSYSLYQTLNTLFSVVSMHNEEYNIAYLVKKSGNLNKLLWQCIAPSGNLH